MTDRHKPSTAVALHCYLAEASVYAPVTSVGAECYVCVLSHGAIALRCSYTLSPEQAATHRPTPTF